MNTGGANFDEAEGVVAETRTCHDGPHPSHLIVSALEGDQVEDLR